MPPTPRELAKELLDSAYASIGAVKPEAQPDLLWRIGDCYTILDKKKALEILNQAFADAAALQDFARTGPGLQGLIAVSVSELDLQRASEMIRAVQVGQVLAGQHDPRAGALQRIVDRMIGKHQIEAAIELVNSLGSGGAYPYESVSAILTELDPEDDPRRIIIFGNALTAYQTRPAREFGQLVAKHWRKLPRGSVVQALDSIVRTVLADRDSDTRIKFKTSYIGKKGAAELPDEQSLELFDIVEPLEACEPAKAKEVFEARPSVKHAYDLFPAGSSSKDISGMSMSVARPAGNSADKKSDPAIMAVFAPSVMKYQQAIDAGSKDLQGALDIIPTIPDPDMRAGAMIEIARSRVESDPALARDLLNKGIALASESKNPDSGFQRLSLAVDVAEKMKDGDLMREALIRSFDAAAAQYRIDSNADDPNVMPINMWPSVHDYRESVGLAEKVYKLDAVTFLDRIKNPELFEIAEVALASALLDRHFFDTKAVVHLPGK